MTLTHFWLWPATGYALVVIGGLLVIWALFWDRARGRRRCPKCWYDLNGVPGLKCPECGREARNERTLFHTRRRWRWAAIGAVVLSTDFGVGAYRQGWDALPDWVLIELLPYAPSNALLASLDRRLADPLQAPAIFYFGPPRDADPHWTSHALSAGGWRRLTGQCVSLLGSSD